MKTVKLIIEDKEIEVQISDEQIAELTKPKKVTGFERAALGETYNLVTMFGNMNFNYEEESGNDNAFYNTANYYTSKELAGWCCRSDNLNRKMRRWAAEHNERPIDWLNERDMKYVINYDHAAEELVVHWAGTCMINSVVCFNTEELAEQAIKEFGDEIKWLAENRPKWF